MSPEGTIVTRELNFGEPNWFRRQTVRGAQEKARVWATCPETKWLMLVDIDIENGTVCINTIYG